MKYNDEKQIMNVLGIDSWNRLSKDKVLKFAAMMPDMDKEVMFKIIDQFPEFRVFAKDVLDSMEKTHESVINANWDNQKQIHETFSELRRILENELNKDITFEEKKYFIDKLFELCDREVKHDDKDKSFLKDIDKNSLIGAGLLLLAAVVWVGGKVFLDKDQS
ncbi:MAG: hypothetical protein GYA02_06930 [Clostridiaceae bacterium]|nr:hypothetical protein [Clostridiaceae bacterium]